MRAIFAVDSKFGVAKDGAIPWEFFKQDKLHFRSITANNRLVLGKATYDTLPGTPLGLGRTLLVATKAKIIREDVTVISGGLVEACKETPNAICIGGPDVLKQVWDLVDHLYLTIIDKDYECDKFLPDVVINALPAMNPFIMETGNSEAGPYKIVHYSR